MLSLFFSYKFLMPPKPPREGPETERLPCVPSTASTGPLTSHSTPHISQTFSSQTFSS
jgi:hypothetical protein